MSVYKSYTIKIVFFIMLLLAVILINGCGKDAEDSNGDPSNKITESFAYLSPDMTEIALSSNEQIIVTVSNLGNTSTEGLNIRLMSASTVAILSELSISDKLPTNIPKSGSITITLKAINATVGQAAKLHISAKNSKDSVTIPIKIIPENIANLVLTSDSGIIGSGNTKTYTLKNISDQRVDHLSIGLYQVASNSRYPLGSIKNNMCQLKTLAKDESCQFDVSILDNAINTNLNIKVFSNDKLLVSEVLSVIRPVLTVEARDTLVSFKSVKNYRYSATTQSSHITIIPGIKQYIVVEDTSPVAIKNMQISIPYLSGIKEDSASTCVNDMTLTDGETCTVILDGSLMHYPSGSGELIAQGKNTDEVERLILGSTSSSGLQMFGNYHIVISSGISVDIPLLVRNNYSSTLNNLTTTIEPDDDNFKISDDNTCLASLQGQSSCNNIYQYIAPTVKNEKSLIHSIVYGNTNNGGYESSGVSLGIDIFPEYFSIANLTNGLATNRLINIYVVDNVLYIITSLGLSISNDSGKTWNNKTAANGLIGGEIYGGSIEGKNIYLTTELGILISNDGGNSWLHRVISDESGIYEVYKVIAKSGYIYAVIDSGIAISKDGGSGWKIITKDHALPNYEIRNIYVNDKTIYLATNNGLVISRDNGDSWINIENGLGSNQVNDIKVANNKLYAATSGGLSISNDQGKTWRTIKKESGLASDIVITLTIRDSDIYAATDKGLSISNDDGKTWYTATVANGLTSNIIREIYIQDNVIYALPVSKSGGGLAISYDSGKSWTIKKATNGFYADRIYHLVSYKDKIYAATNHGLSISKDNTHSWSTITVEDGLPSNLVWDIAISGNDLYVATKEGVAISSNGGQSWIIKTTSNGLVSNATYSIGISGDRIYVGTEQGLSISSDKGETWHLANLSRNQYSQLQVFGITIDGSNAVYAATSNGLFISIDNGATWKAITTKSGLIDNVTRDVAIIGDSLYVGTDKGISISHNQGKTWLNISTLSNNDFNAVFGIYVQDNTVYAATYDSGLLVSYDRGNTWQTKTTENGLSSNELLDVIVFNNNVYVATGNGISILGAVLIPN
ncbi:YCF48-related protein [Thiotrichales bacterium 19X7-9]|nr:YCF48-related protein [Thiotrichales bacterium 19X7-9]